MDYKIRNELSNLVQRIAPIIYYFQKITGQKLYTEEDVRNILQDFSRLKQPTPDRLSTEGGRGVWPKFVEFSHRLLAKLVGK